jgi:opacity protein-like surface antigen
MRFQKILLYLFLTTMAVGCDRYGAFLGCNGCFGFWGCEQWELSDDHFIRHESGLPFGFYFSVGGLGHFNAEGPSVNGTTNSDAFARLGIQHFMTNHLAFRVFLTIDRFSDGADSNERVNSSYGAGAGLLYYFAPLYNIATYVGAGLGYSTSTYADYQIPEIIGGKESPQGISSPLGETTRSAFGVTAVAGFDWYLTPNIAIGSEYALGFSSISRTFKDSQGNETDFGAATSLGITPGGNLHMLIHF